MESKNFKEEHRCPKCGNADFQYSRGSDFYMLCTSCGEMYRVDGKIGKLLSWLNKSEGDEMSQKLKSFIIKNEINDDTSFMVYEWLMKRKLYMDAPMERINTWLSILKNGAIII